MTVATPPLPHAPRALAGKVMGVAFCRCGQPLEIRGDDVVCPAGCADAAELMVLQAVRGPKPGHPDPRKGKPRGRYVLKPKPCATCARDFQPTGPNAKYCNRADCYATMMLARRTIPKVDSL